MCQRRASGLCPIAERVQPKLVQVPTNCETEAEGPAQADALRRTIAKLSGK